jgi:alpha-L-rhamnosidase
MERPLSDPTLTFIAPATAGAPDRVVRIGTRFDLELGHGDVAHASLAFTALGVVEPLINGSAASRSLLTPGWSSYEWRLRYSETEVDGLKPAANELVLRLAAGWYAGRLGFMGNRAAYGDRAAAAARLAITYTDGHRQLVETDESWLWGEDRSLAADLYDGETIDARIMDRPLGGSVEIVSYAGSLEPYRSPEVVRHESVAPVSVFRSPAGRLLVDFGQNLVGFVRLAARGDEGTEIVVRHAEVLENDELGVRPLRSAEATDRFILSGGDDVFEPTFTFHGFRYVEIEGWPHPDGELSEALEAIVVGSALRRIGCFSTSNEMLNRFEENVVWGTRGNFVDVPTDCPQRDERLGWTGDIAAFAPTAAFMFDVQDFLSDWLRDMKAEVDAADGNVPRRYGPSDLRCRRRCGAMRRSGFRGPFSSTTATSIASRSTPTSCAPMHIRSRACSTTTAPGARVSSSAIGSTPPLRPRIPQTPVPHASSSRPPAHTVTSPSSPRPSGDSADPPTDGANSRTV